MMLELKEKVYAHLNELGFVEVQARLARGERIADARLVREWLELHPLKQSQIPEVADIDAHWHL